MCEEYWRGKTALVTGGSRGIGHAIAKRLVGLGVRTAISGRDESRLEAAAEGLGSPNKDDILTLTGNVACEEGVEDWVNRIVEKWGKLDFLVNNAGITRDNLLIRMKSSDWDEVINTNLKGVFLCSRVSAKVMMKQRFGRIVNISSIVGNYGNVGQVNYAAAKGGMNALTKSMAKELAPRNILVNAIAPGFTETEMTDSLPEKIGDMIREKVPLKRFATPDEIAGPTVFLLSEQAGYITGQVISVDGGLVI